MSAATLDLPAQKETLNKTAGFQDDFDTYSSGGRWTSTLSDSGSIAVLATTGDNGQIAVIPSDGSVGDNDESYFATTNSIFKIIANRMLQLEADVQFAEANTSAANVCVCFADAIGANLMVDNGAGMKTSFSGAAIYKVDGETVWRCVCSLSTTQQITKTGVTAGGTAFMRLKIEIRALDATLAEVTYWYDDGSGMRQFLDPTQKVATPIKHIFTYTGAVAMMAGGGCKNGSTSLETVNVDYFSAYQSRRNPLA